MLDVALQNIQEARNVLAEKAIVTPLVIIICRN
jgi:hypothetical protein